MSKVSNVSNEYGNEYENGHESERENKYEANAKTHVFSYILVRVTLEIIKKLFTSPLGQRGGVFNTVAALAEDAPWAGPGTLQWQSLFLPNRFGKKRKK